jgi:glycosidase
MIRRYAAALFASLALVAMGVAAGCGNDKAQNPDYGMAPDSGVFDPGTGGNGSGYGSGANNGSSGGSSGGVSTFDAGPPVCPDSLKLCAETFTYPFNGETSVVLRGSYNATAWTVGDPMQHVGSVWTVSVPVPWAQAVQYKFWVNGTTWNIDPGAPTITDATNNTNNVKTAITCPDSYTCDEPPVPPAGVFDWRDAVIYFVFVDRFMDGEPANNCNVPGTTPNSTSSTNYLGGDWAGVTQKINSGYFNDLGVNTLWITVPIKNADAVLGQGVNGDTNEYSAYHGYWPADPTLTEPCFGTEAELQGLVTAAHAKNLKVLFDYAMVHVHTSSTVYTTNQNNGWFTTGANACICGSSNSCPFNTTCWFAPYLAHYDYTNADARNFSINATILLVQNMGNDAFRLDAIKQVDPSWLAALRPAITSQILAKETPQQRFYMVGETYDFQNRALIKSMVDPTAQLDGQFDFPLRIRLIEAMLMRSTQNMLTVDDLNWSRNAPPGMTGLAQFYQANTDYYGVTSVMSTFIGNHDLPRSIHYAEQTLPSWLSASSPSNPSAADGKNVAWSGQPALETDPNTYERLANAFAVLLTNKGAPLIYYGDEIGLPGAGDPDNRRMMQWSGLSAAQSGLYARIKALTGVRAAHGALRRGAQETLYVDEDLWVFSMSIAGDTVYVGINRSDADRTTTSVPVGIPELLTGTTSSATTTIPARETRIFSSSPSDLIDAGADAN